MRQFSAPWPHLSVISIIDTLLVAVIIYEFLALIRGTRASLMVVGVAGLGLAFYLSRLGNMAALNWVISTLLPYTVFALIVVFAAESGKPWRDSGGAYVQSHVGFGGGRL